MPLSVARVIIVAGDQRGRSLVQSLTRMGLADIRLVAIPEEARRLCATDRIDACLAILPPFVPDEVPLWTVEAGAPGRDIGVPSLLLAQPVTPHAARAAHRAGYRAVAPADISPRLLYRWIRALLQKKAQQARAAAQQRRLDGQPADAMHVIAHATSPGGKLRLQ